jgi:hypothetical protein
MIVLEQKKSKPTLASLDTVPPATQVLIKTTGSSRSSIIVKQLADMSDAPIPLIKISYRANVHFGKVFAVRISCLYSPVRVYL